MPLSRPTKIFTSCLLLFLVEAVPVFASITAPTKKSVMSWCNEESFYARGRFQAYGGPVQLIGVEALKIGTLNPQWTCHWIISPGVGEHRGYDLWWTKKEGQEPYRMIERLYDDAGNITSSSYTDTWFAKNKKGKKLRCAYTSSTKKTVCKKKSQM